MLRSIAAASFSLLVATSAQGMTPAPLHEPNDLLTQIAVGCGPGRTRVNGVCVARTTVRQKRRAVRRCVRWQAGICASYQCTYRTGVRSIGRASRPADRRLSYDNTVGNEIWPMF
jgi:hypothetical protein